jgi:hypothetical protein
VLNQAVFYRFPAIDLSIRRKFMGKFQFLTCKIISHVCLEKLYNNYNTASLIKSKQYQRMEPDFYSGSIDQDCQALSSAANTGYGMIGFNFNEGWRAVAAIFPAMW